MSLCAPQPPPPLHSAAAAAAASASASASASATRSHLKALHTTTADLQQQQQQANYNDYDYDDDDDDSSTSSSSSSSSSSPSQSPSNTDQLQNAKDGADLELKRASPTESFSHIAMPTSADRKQVAASCSQASQEDNGGGGGGGDVDGNEGEESVVDDHDDDDGQNDDRNDDQHDGQHDDDQYDGDSDDNLDVSQGALSRARDIAEQLAKEASLEIVESTNERQRVSELAHQLGSGEDDEPSSQLIGQLTYRLFAPCQLVSSSSCFSINPINSSSPLSRRGSVNLNGSNSANASSGLSSENAIPSTLLLSSAASASGGCGGLSNLSDSMASINIQGGPLLASSAAQPIQHHQHQHHQQTISFGAFFPALSQDLIHASKHSMTSLQAASGGGGGHSSSATGSSANHFMTNEFEPVEAIKRRMEIYVTTNSMKVLAGETLVVNLSDQLSCLSTAIAETIVKASFSTNRPASTWVSVYILYAAVDEPHLPSQLLEQQRLRERLTLISEEGEESGGVGGVGSVGGQSASRKVSRSDLQASVGADLSGSVGRDNMMPVFDDEFKLTELPSWSQSQQQQQQPPPPPALAADQQQQQQVDSKPLASLNKADGSIRVELVERGASCSSSLYNSAYDRTVALPSQPDNQLNDYLEPVDFNLNPQQLAADGLWFDDENDLNAAAAAQAGPMSHQHQQHGLISLTSVSVRAAQRQMRLRQSGETKIKLANEKRKNKLNKNKKKNSAKRLIGSSSGRSHSEDSQCSVM